MNTDAPKVELPDIAAHLGERYDASWDYRWVLPTSVHWLTKKGFTQVSDPIEFYYGSTMVLVGRAKAAT